MISLRRILPCLLLAALVVSLFGVAARAADDARFVGSAGCVGCHQAQAALWKGSHHTQAMQPARDATVLGDFADARFVNGGITSVFHRDGARFMVRTEGPDGVLHEFEIAHTFGVYPLQQYLIALPGGRLQALGIAWDSRPTQAGGQRWYALYPDQSLAPGSRLHWTGRDQTWNYMCAACHTTDLHKKYDLAADSYATTFVETGVGCEACHGPGSRHLDWAKGATSQGAPEDPRKGIVAWLKANTEASWVMDAARGIARRSVPRASDTELEVCAGCHARAGAIADSPVPGTPFLDAYLPVLLEPGLYHADGQIEGEVFEYGSFLQSRMHQAGVTCSDCHEPHGASLRAEGNALCAQCHMPAKFDVPAHHHHQVDSAGAQCANCHMPTRTYMGVDARRDHSIRVPRPDLSVSLGTPNACSGCHAEKDAAWAAGVVAGWFPGGRQTQPHYGQVLAAGRAGGVGAERLVDGLIGDRAAPGIARATALLELPRIATAASLPVWRAALADPDPLVRLGAVRGQPGGASTNADLLPLLADPTLAVRTEAARALAGIDPMGLTAPQRAALARATEELRVAFMVSADRPETHVNFGLLDTRLGLSGRAAADYQTALRLDPGFVPALVNLADLDRAQGQDGQGVAHLQQALALEPDNADAHHALGLLLVRRKDYPGALRELERAQSLAPDNARYVYVYAVALNSTGAPTAAWTVLQQAQTRFPANTDILSALVSFAQARGDGAAALSYARSLQALRPGDARLAGLIAQLQAAMSH